MSTKEEGVRREWTISMVRITYGLLPQHPWNMHPFLFWAYFYCLVVSIRLEFISLSKDTVSYSRAGMATITFPFTLLLDIALGTCWVFSKQFFGRIYQPDVPYHCILLSRLFSAPRWFKAHSENTFHLLSTAISRHRADHFTCIISIYPPTPLWGLNYSSAYLTTKVWRN